MTIVGGHRCTVTVALGTQYPVWQDGRAGGQPFICKVTVRYEQQTLWYRPGFWQEVKFGWVQYLAILLPLWYLLDAFRSFAFNNQVVVSIIRPVLGAKTA